MTLLEALPAHPLEQRRPGFLTLIDTDPDRAWTEFHQFAWKQLRAYPPRIFQDLDPATRDDLIAEIVLDCRRDDFHMLRGYRDEGVPFAAWLGRVARNRALSHRRREGTSDRVMLEGSHPSGEPPPDDAVHYRRSLDVVRDFIQRLNDKCRHLLSAAAAGFKPAEIAAQLGVAARDGKQVSDDLRWCRRGLRRLLREGGFDDLLGDIRKDPA